jgi:hypothetical protein
MGVMSRPFGRAAQFLLPPRADKDALLHHPHSRIVRSRKFGARCPNDPIPTRFGNANGGLLIHAVDKSPEIGAAVIDDNVEGSARPRLILDAVDEALMQNARDVPMVEGAPVILT